ncbi:MAG TPA: class I adenylate-forming enzyme family protein [Rhizomicrobium sp.]|nr:class I adenylate-forming enzyme family protein [Rhizomicrobium sp.]
MDSVFDNTQPRLEPPFTPTVAAMIGWICRQYGARDAQIRGNSRITYEELDARSSLFARGLLARGIGKGSRIALLMPDGPDFTVAFLAAARIGAVVAPLSTLFKARELQWVLKHGDFQLLLASAHYLTNNYVERLEAAFPDLEGQRAGRLVLRDAPYLRSILIWGNCDKGWAGQGAQALSDSAAEWPDIDDTVLRNVEESVVPSDLLCIIFTSGSSADPKGVVHTHAAMLRHSWQKAHRYWTVGLDGERLIGARPHFWVADLAATLFQSLLRGICLLTPDDNSAKGVLRLIKDEGATAACGNLPWLKSLVSDATLKASGYEVFITSLECAAFAKSGADGLHFLNAERARRVPLPVQQLIDRMPRSYGMTETLAAHTSIPAETLIAPDLVGACGRPMPGVRIRIVDPATGTPVKRGEIGEIQVAGYCLMNGLYKRENADTFTPDGFYASGDLGKMDEQGYINFHSRMGEMLKVRGANVAPAEVEACLMAMPNIVRAAVVGLESPGDGITLVAGVEMEPAALFDEGEIRQALRRELSAFKIPKHIFSLAMEEFPLTASGKVRKHALSAILSAMMN